MIFLITDSGFYYEGSMVDALHYTRKYGPRHTRTVHVNDVVLRDIDSMDHPLALRMASSLWEQNIDPLQHTLFISVFNGLCVLVCPD